MFKKEGYIKEYYIGFKFIGTVASEKDRDDFGYSGRKIEIAENKIILDNKKSIKKGEKVLTILYPMCGKVSQ